MKRSETERLRADRSRSGELERLSVVRRRRVLVAVFLAVVVCAAAVAVRHNPVFSAIERPSVDLRFTLRGSRKPPRNVLIVGLNESSLENLPQFPFSRRIQARVLEQLHRAGARLIVDDFVFDRPTGPADQVLFDAAARAAPVVFGATEIDHGQTEVLGGNANVLSIGDRVAAALLPADPDGVVRHLASEVYGLPSIASVVKEIVTGRMLSARQLASSGAWIDFFGGPGTFPSIRFDRVASGHFSSRSVRGKIVLVGATAKVLQDLHPTAVGGGDMAGVEIQANAIASVLANLPLRSASGWLQLLVLVLAVAVIAAVATACRALAVAATGVVVLVAWCVVTVVAFDAGTMFDFTPVMFAVALATTGGLAIAAFEDSRERREVRQLFAAGSPELVRRVLSGDSRLRKWASQIVAGYTIEEVISEGGMGIVYRANQRRLDRMVALKVILPRFVQSPEHRARFELECQAAAAIEHPNVIPVYDTGNDEDVLYIAMPVVARSLSDELYIPIAPARTVRIIEQIAGALDAAHALQIVHRDVKPSNVLITSDEPEHVYLTDFGIARWLGESRQLTRADGWLGTAAYASPEQILGEQVDPRADIYSLAAVLFHCLTAEVPYPGETSAAISLSHLNDAIPTATAVNPTLPAAIDAVLAIGLAKKPDDRFSAATDLARAAAAALGVASTLAAPPSRETATDPGSSQGGTRSRAGGPGPADTTPIAGSDETEIA